MLSSAHFIAENITKIQKSQVFRQLIENLPRDELIEYAISTWDIDKNIKKMEKRQRILITVGGPILVIIAIASFFL